MTQSKFDVFLTDYIFDNTLWANQQTTHLSALHANGIFDKVIPTATKAFPERRAVLVICFPHRKENSDSIALFDELRLDHIISFRCGVFSSLPQQRPLSHQGFQTMGGSLLSGWHSVAGSILCFSWSRILRFSRARDLMFLIPIWWCSYQEGVREALCDAVDGGGECSQGPAQTVCTRWCNRNNVRLA